MEIDVRAEVDDGAEATEVIESDVGGMTRNAASPIDR